MAKLSTGLIQIYTGEGKGKTTASFGLALRAIGHGLNVYIIQFMKGQGNYGELEALRKFAPQCEIESYGLKSWVKLGGENEQHTGEADKGLERARQVLTDGQWDMVILDELVTCVMFGLIKEEKVLELMESKPSHVELVLTGHRATQNLMARADLVTEMLSIKHPYEKGIIGRKGIEF